MRRYDYERTGDPDEDLVYTFFHPSGLITLTEYDLVNEYMRLRGKCDELQEQLKDERKNTDRSLSLVLAWNSQRNGGDLPEEPLSLSELIDCAEIERKALKELSESSA